jgi:hypothetical protein
VGFGNDVMLVHQSASSTHDAWWSAMSISGVLNLFDQFEKSGNTVSTVLSSATGHADTRFVREKFVSFVCNVSTPGITTLQEIQHVAIRLPFRV